MITPQEFRQQAHATVDWIADFLENIEQYPVKSQVQPRQIIDRLPANPPLQGEAYNDIFADFRNLVLDGVTHWQHPSFFAYFPANSSYPSQLAEMLTTALGAQCMMWDTSPAAAEMEERMMQWLAQMLGIPANFDGVIQDTASTSTLAALLTAREQYTKGSVNNDGFEANKRFRVYCSHEAHSSIDRAVKIAGIGHRNLVKVPVDEQLRMIPAELDKAIQNDLDNGYIPLFVMAAIGTTGTTAIDPLAAIANICSQRKIWLHIDAAYAGTALVLPEYRWMIEGIEQADSFVFNPHKWMFTNFDCSVYFVRDKEALISTFEMIPEYLKSAARKVNNYKDWGIPLGRRFRALKLWFVIRSFGIEGIQQKIRHHIELAKQFETWLLQSGKFEIMAPRTLNLVCFRYKGTSHTDNNTLDNLNEQLLHKINATGKMYLTHTKVKGCYTLRMVIGQTNVEMHHIQQAWDTIQSLVDK